MNAKTKSWLAGAVGALIGVVGIAVFVVTVAPADSVSLRQQVLAAKVAALEQARVHAPTASATIDRTAGVVVAAAIAGGLALTILGWSWSRAAARRNDQKGAALRGALRARQALEQAPGVVAVHVADATASEFDETKQPDFIPVASLTEAQARRQAAQRQRQAHRTALNIA